MGISELNTLLKSLGYDLAYHHFKEKPTLPFIAYYEEDREYTYADNLNLHERMRILVEVYTQYRQDNIIEEVKKLLTNNGISYSLTPFTWIDDDDMYMTLFEFELTKYEQ